MRRQPISILVLTAALALGCAQLPQLPANLAAGLKTPPIELSARGPGAIFDTIDAAAVDALAYGYLQAREAGDLQRMRAGTIRRSGAGYTYDEIHVAKRWSARHIQYRVRVDDVARFHVYPLHTDREINSINERLSALDRRSVSVIDPLHRPLYVLHPSLAVRAYRADQDPAEITNLGGPARPWQWPSLFARR